MFLTPVEPHPKRLNPSGHRRSLVFFQVRMRLASQNRALASVLATFLAPAFSGSCSRLSPGHTSCPCRVPPGKFESERSSANHSFFQSGCSWPLIIVLSPQFSVHFPPQSWVHFRHQTHQNHALALVLATFPTSGSPGANETIGFYLTAKTDRFLVGSKESRK